MTQHHAPEDAAVEQQQLMQLVGFLIGKEQFGVDILMVQEIIQDARITEVPNAPDFVEGVINLRGNIIPVIDLHKRLNLSVDRTEEDATNLKTWILILDIENRITGFIVDRVTEVLKVPKQSIEPPPEIIMVGLDSQYIHGVCDIGSALLILLNFKNILQVEEIKRLKEMGRTRSQEN